MLETSFVELLLLCLSLSHRLFHQYHSLLLQPAHTVAQSLLQTLLAISTCKVTHLHIDPPIRHNFLNTCTFIVVLGKTTAHPGHICWYLGNTYIQPTSKALFTTVKLFSPKNSPLFSQSDLVLAMLPLSPLLLLHHGPSALQLIGVVNWGQPLFPPPLLSCSFYHLHLRQPSGKPLPWRGNQVTKAIWGRGSYS